MAKDDVPWDDPPTPEEKDKATTKENGVKKAPWKGYVPLEDDPVPAKPIIGEVDDANIVEGKRTRTKVSPAAEVQAPAKTTPKKNKKAKDVKEVKEVKEVKAKAKVSPEKSESPASEQSVDPSIVTPENMKNDILSVVSQSLQVAENFAKLLQRYEEHELAQVGIDMDEELDDVLKSTVKKRKAAKKEENPAKKPRILE